MEDRACPSCRRIRRARTATKTAVAANEDSIGLPAARGTVPVAKAARDPVPVPVARAPVPVARAPVPFARVGLPVPVARDPVPAAVPAPVARDAVPVPVARAPVPVARGAKFRQSKRHRNRERPSRKKSKSPSRRDTPVPVARGAVPVAKAAVAVSYTQRLDVSSFSD